MTNAFLDDAVYCLRRASRALSDDMGRDQLYDATIYYAFGIEKVCKAIVHDVNPVFLLENPKFENAAAVFYPDRLLPPVLKKFETEKGYDRQLHAFKASMLMAAKFCKVVEDHIGAFTQLADYRGIVAHRSIGEMDTAAAARFLVKTFYPTVVVLAEALEFEETDCFDTPKKQEELRKASDAILAKEDFADEMRALLARHKAMWDARKTDPEEVEKRKATTRAVLAHRMQGLYSTEMTCPACGQPCVLFYRFVDKIEDDAIATVGGYAVGLACFFCDLKIQGYGAIDHFKLNEQLQKAFGQ